jgi:hypothetical protein
MTPTCRFCDTPLAETLVDLGLSPLSNAFVAPASLDDPETFLPLHVYVCSKCLLVQLPEHESPNVIFTDYAYLSSYSQTWLDHCERFAERMVDELELKPDSRVVEIASNDGYLLQFFMTAGVQVLGIEPAANVAQIASARGIPTESAFFGRQTAARLVNEGVRPRLIVGNNVLAHVPDLNDFVAGIATLANSETLVTLEFPHLLRLIEDRQFDTIYHEHFSYFSLLVVERIATVHGLTVHDVEELPTHGGSLRIFASLTQDAPPVSQRVTTLRAKEAAARLEQLDAYRSFAGVVADLKCDILEFLIGARRAGSTVVGYGAPAKGNTLLNYCGIGPELVAFTVDRNPLKQGAYLPGSHIPVLAPDAIFEARPPYVLILPWNIRDEVTEQMESIREWGGRFVVLIPRVEILG